MTLFFEFLALLSIMCFLLYFRMVSRRLPKRKKQLHPVAVFRPTARRSMTRSEWKRGQY